jgi:hypothetical protein
MRRAGGESLGRDRLSFVALSAFPDRGGTWRGTGYLRGVISLHHHTCRKLCSGLATRLVLG